LGLSAASLDLPAQIKTAGRVASSAGGLSSDVHEVKNTVAQGFVAGPPHGETRPPREAATRTAVEPRPEQMRGTQGGKVSRRPVHGVLLLDKPLGWSSNDVLQKVKWLLRAEKAGHTGTLDPLASGVLPLCFGAATKFSQLQLDADKTYEAVVRLGLKTSTGDAEGDVIQTRQVAVSPEDIAQVAGRFTGLISQVPPMHSALKKDGKALYEYARAGIEVDRAARQVTIHELNMVLAQIDNGRKAINMIVKCSKGTYIRTLGEDIGEALGCGAHLSALRRIGTGGFEVAQCVTLEALEAMTEDQRLACLHPVSSLLVNHTVVTLDDDNAARFLSGLRRRVALPDAAQVAVVAAGDQQLLGTAHIVAGELIPGRLLSPIEIEQMKLNRQTHTRSKESANEPRTAVGEPQSLVHPL
jgi:tRNA pseudouridine55 synthase